MRQEKKQKSFRISGFVFRTVSQNTERTERIGGADEVLRHSRERETISLLRIEREVRAIVGVLEQSSEPFLAC